MSSVNIINLKTPLSDMEELKSNVAMLLDLVGRMIVEMDDYQNAQSELKLAFQKQQLQLDKIVAAQSLNAPLASPCPFPSLLPVTSPSANLSSPLPRRKLFSQSSPASAPSESLSRPLPLLRSYSISISFSSSARRDTSSPVDEFEDYTEEAVDDTDCPSTQDDYEYDSQSSPFDDYDCPDDPDDDYDSS